MPLTWHQIPRGGSNPGAQPGGRVEDEIGDDAVTDDTTLVIEVVDETIEGDNALLQSRLDVTPFGGLHDAGDVSNGKMRSVPVSSPYTLKVIPMLSRASSAAS